MQADSSATLKSLFMFILLFGQEIYHSVGDDELRTENQELQEQVPLIFPICCLRVLVPD